MLLPQEMKRNIGESRQSLSCKLALLFIEATLHQHHPPVFTLDFHSTDFAWCLSKGFMLSDVAVAEVEASSHGCVLQLQFSGHFLSVISPLRRSIMLFPYLPEF